MSKYDGLIERLSDPHSATTYEAQTYTELCAEAIAAIRELEARTEALELAVNPLAILAADPIVNMNDPLSKWFTIAQLFAARDALGRDDQSNG